MNVTNIMNFVRTFEPRDAECESKLLDTAKEQLRQCKRLGLPATFLLEYDALVNPDYTDFFKAEADDSIELGFWYEVVEPLTTDIGIPYESKHGYRWDWNIKPGFSISYTNDIKEKLIDQAMNKFREVFGYYPRTVASWVLDTYTVSYLTEKYDIDALAICRDQINTDAYTLVGGYFSGLYFPSKNNIFTPASCEENSMRAPVIKLLGADPIHNYDSSKYLADKTNLIGVYTLEPACEGGSNPKIVDWFFRTYYDNENLGIGYTQIGQENSFALLDIVSSLEMQYKKLMEKGVKFEKMCDTGAAFKKNYKLTPPAAVSALDNWDTVDCQSVYYSSKSYVANLLRHEGTVTLRSIYFFDDRIKDTYIDSLCETFSSIHENMPIVDTFPQRGEGDGGYGIVLTTDAKNISSRQADDGGLLVEFDGGSVLFSEDSMTLTGCSFDFAPEMCNTKISTTDDSIEYEYKGHRYALLIKGGKVNCNNGHITVDGDTLILTPSKR